MRAALLPILLLLAASGCGPDPAREYFYESPLRPYFSPESADPTLLVPRRAGTSAKSFRLPKPRGLLRVFVVGGSIAALHQELPSDLGRLLAAALPDRTVEVINCGQAGYESEREERLARELVAYEPDLVVLMTGHNERDDAPLLPLWRLRLGALTARLRPARAPAPVDADRRARLQAAFERRVDELLATLQAAGVPALVVLPPLNAEHPTEASWPRDADFLAGWRAFLAGDGARARAAWKPVLDEARDGASLAAILDARASLRAGRSAEARREALAALDARPLFGGRCAKACRDALAAAAARRGAAVADLDAAFRRAAAPGFPGYAHFDDAVHWNAAHHALAMKAVLAGARTAPRWRDLEWNGSLPALPSPPRDENLFLYAVAALGSAGAGAPPPAAVLALERVLRLDPAALDGGLEAARGRAAGHPGFRRAWGAVELSIDEGDWAWATGLARLHAFGPRAALDALAAAASLRPEASAARLHLGAALALAGRLMEADAAFEAALPQASEPRRAAALAALALGARSRSVIAAALPPLEERLAARRRDALALQAARG
ncbi:MAG: GDSL-type esterase/lipase family protein, partial [Elusimicrobiota bacterium]|nr:GDSL-type esterase/lipase family protein [Elusimicrobiota bacterium]